MGPPQAREDAMRRIYHTLHFEVLDEKALHEFVRKHADPEELSAMEQLDAGQPYLCNNGDTFTSAALHGFRAGLPSPCRLISHERIM